MRLGKGRHAISRFREQRGREKAAQAMNQRDQARCDHWRKYFRDMFLCEAVDGPDRQNAREAYDNAYRETRNVPKVR